MTKPSADAPGAQSRRSWPAEEATLEEGGSLPGVRHGHLAVTAAAVLVAVDDPGAGMRQRGRCKRHRRIALPSWRRAVAATVTAFALWLAVAGCGDTAPSADGPASTAPGVSAPPQTARDAAQRQAVAAWQGMWQAYAKAGLTANPDEADLARYAADRALQTLTNGLKSYKDKGHILKGDLVTNPRASDPTPAADPTTVTVLDCVDDSKFLVYKNSGELLNDTPGGRHSAKATVTKLADGWKVTSFGLQAINTC